MGCSWLACAAQRWDSRTPLVYSTSAHVGCVPPLRHAGFFSAQQGVRIPDDTWEVGETCKTENSASIVIIQGQYLYQKPFHQQRVFSKSPFSFTTFRDKRSHSSPAVKKSVGVQVTTGSYPTPIRVLWLGGKRKFLVGTGCILTKKRKSDDDTDDDDDDGDDGDDDDDDDCMQPNDSSCPDGSCFFSCRSNASISEPCSESSSWAHAAPTRPWPLKAPK